MDLRVGGFSYSSRVGFRPLHHGLVVLLRVNLVAVVVDQRPVAAEDLAPVTCVFDRLGEHSQAVGGTQLALAHESRVVLQLVAAVGAVVDVGVRVGFYRSLELA